MSQENLTANTVEKEITRTPNVWQKKRQAKNFVEILGQKPSTSDMHDFRISDSL